MEKKNKQIMAAFAAGLAVAGAAAWWLQSKNGKQMKKKITDKRDRVLEEADHIILDARSKFDALRQELTGKDRSETKATEDLIM